MDANEKNDPLEAAALRTLGTGEDGQRLCEALRIAIEVAVERSREECNQLVHAVLGTLAAGAKTIAEAREDPARTALAAAAEIERLKDELEDVNHQLVVLAREKRERHEHTVNLVTALAATTCLIEEAATYGAGVLPAHWMDSAGTSIQHNRRIITAARGW